MRNLNKLLTTTIIGGLLISSYSYVDSTNDKIHILEDKLELKTKELDDLNKEVKKRNKIENEITKKITEDNNALRRKIDELESRKIHFNPNDVTQPSNLTSKRLEKIFNEDGTYKNLRGLEDAFVDAEKVYHINAVFLASLISQESGFGTSRRAIEDNNLGGLAVYGDYSEGMHFGSKSECVYYMAKLLSNNYLKEGGSSYRGVSVYAINESYSASLYSWSENIVSIANTYMSQLNAE